MARHGDVDVSRRRPHRIAAALERRRVAMIGGKAKVDLRAVSTRAFRRWRDHHHEREGNHRRPRKLEADGRRDRRRHLVHAAAVSSCRRRARHGRTSAARSPSPEHRRNSRVRARAPRQRPGGTVTVSITGDAIIGRDITPPRERRLDRADHSAGDMQSRLARCEGKERHRRYRRDHRERRRVLNDVVDTDGGDGGGTVVITAEGIT